MYIEAGFYDLIPGKIGTVHYSIDLSKGMTEEQRQEFVSRESGERMRAYLNNVTYGLSSDPVDPMAAYEKARKESWSSLEGGGFKKMKEVHVQVAQKESYELLLKIEKRPDFAGWMNPLLVSALKEAYEKTIHDEPGVS